MFLSIALWGLLATCPFGLAVTVAYLRRQMRGDQANGPSQSLGSRWGLAPALLGTWKTWWCLLQICSGLPRQLHLGGIRGSLARSARPWWSTHSQGLVLWQTFLLQTALLIAIINPSPSQWCPVRAQLVGCSTRNKASFYTCSTSALELAIQY